MSNGRTQTCSWSPDVEGEHRCTAWNYFHLPHRRNKAPQRQHLGQEVHFSHHPAGTALALSNVGGRSPAGGLGQADPVLVPSLLWGGAEQTHHTVQTAAEIQHPVSNVKPHTSRGGQRGQGLYSSEKQVLLHVHECIQHNKFILTNFSAFSQWVMN